MHIFFIEYLKFISFILGKQDVAAEYTRTVDVMVFSSEAVSYIKYVCLKHANVVKYIVLKVKCRNTHNNEDKNKTKKD